MKLRLALFTTMLLLAAAAVAAVGPPPAQAAAPFAAHLSRTNPVVGEVVRMYGAVGPTHRVVTLQTARGTRWVGLRSTRTGAGGRFSFAIRAGSTSARYRVFAPRLKRYVGRTSSIVSVLGQRPSLLLAPPVESRSGSTGVVVVPATARMTPTRPGATVTLFRRSGESWVAAGTAVQNSAGVARFASTVRGHADTYRAVAATGYGAPSVSSEWMTTGVYPAQTFDEEFAGSGLDPSVWATRFQEYTAVGGGRHCAKPGEGLVSVADGVATLRVARAPSSEPAGSDCPHGRWRNAMVGTAALSAPFGLYQARVKFQSAPGMHGAFWLQGAGDDAAEIDAAEYFGDGRSTGGLASFVHRGSLANATSYGAELPVTRSIAAAQGAGQTVSNSWHVVAVQWSPTGYVFTLDGAPTMVIHSLVSTVGSKIVLSLLTSDWELPRLTNPTSTMQVDWVRAYQ